MPKYVAVRPEQAPRQEPISFELRGETFECAPTVPDWAGVELAAASEDNPTEAAQALVRFILVALMPAEEGRFKELVRRKYRPPAEDDEGWDPIQNPELEGLVEWLAGVYTDRPTMRPSSSQRGPSPNGATSTDASSSPVTRTGPAGGTGEAS
jgi:hypothetical protein